MKMLIDFLPIVIFFIVYKLTDDLILATAVLIPATMLQMAYTWFTTKKVEKMQLVTLVLVVVLGGLTVALQDGQFIKWKPTIVNWLFSLAFLGSQFIGQKPIVQRLMGKSVELPSQVWRKLNVAWVVFFAAMGGINLYVAFNYSESTWVDFKLFGMLGLTFVFIIAQGLYMSRFMPKDMEKED
ncbi:septation protein A [Oceanospirillaceae bacterium]|jgi:intracellular septation protein|uniref:septation protein A n=1 Tax=Candidatus Njordibacter sp. Uisw_002 TaxID=3230971 RepID=UPI00236B81D1|nr:septation protein A [Oceanospirillaceae bacterium]MDC1341582.1 septation protein A [Oceanospirillaceae bacterium]|tara:strand:+ start:2876 stop:3424 length:549 start_codon:yes stop_codon:yes gene_type:complete